MESSVLILGPYAQIADIEIETLLSQGIDAYSKQAKITFSRYGPPQSEDYKIIGITDEPWRHPEMGFIRERVIGTARNLDNALERIEKEGRFRTSPGESNLIRGLFAENPAKSVYLGRNKNSGLVIVSSHLPRVYTGTSLYEALSKAIQDTRN